MPKTTASPTDPGANQIGDEWFNTTTNRLYKFVPMSGAAPTWQEIALNATSTTASSLASLSVTGTASMSKVRIDNASYSQLAPQPVYKTVAASNSPAGQNTSFVSVGLTVPLGMQNSLMLIHLHSAMANTTTYPDPLWRQTSTGRTQTLELVTRPWPTSNAKALYILRKPLTGAGTLYFHTNAAYGTSAYQGLAASLWDNVDQTNPIGTIYYANGVKTAGGGTASDTMRNLTAGQLIVCGVTYWNGAANDTVNTAYTSLYNNTTDGGHKHMGWYLTASGASQAITFTYANSLDLTYWPIYVTLNGASSSRAVSNLEVNGSVGYGITVVRSQTILNETHNVVFVDDANNSGSTISIILPDCTGCVGRTYQVKRRGSLSPVSITCLTTNQTIDGSASAFLGSQYQSVTLIASEREWNVI